MNVTNNFSEAQLNQVVNRFNGKMDPYLNKGGNITIYATNDKVRDQKFVISLSTTFDGEQGYMVRSYKKYRPDFAWSEGNVYCYPLNMKKKPYNYEVCGTIYKQYEYSTKYSMFGTFEEALDYFEKYINKFHKEMLI